MSAAEALKGGNGCDPFKRGDEAYSLLTLVLRCAGFLSSSGCAVFDVPFFVNLDNSEGISQPLFGGSVPTEAFLTLPQLLAI